MILRISAYWTSAAKWSHRSRSETYIHPINQHGPDHMQIINLTNQETGCKLTGPPQYRSLCISERHVCRV